MKPDSIPELKGKAARAFEKRIREPCTPQHKWLLRKAEVVYETVKKQ